MDTPIDLLAVPAAYLSFGSTPYALDDPPAVGESQVYTVRVECVGESRSVKADGELRYGRRLKIVYAFRQHRAAAQRDAPTQQPGHAVKEGDPAPPDTDAEQPPLFAEDDGLGEFHPEFSHNGDEQ